MRSLPSGWLTPTPISLTRCSASWCKTSHNVPFPSTCASGSSLAHVLGKGTLCDVLHHEAEQRVSEIGVGVSHPDGRLRMHLRDASGKLCESKRVLAQKCGEIFARDPRVMREH